MDTNDYAELFDVEIDEGENVQALAEPAESAAEEGEKEQEAAVPAEETAQEPDCGAETAVTPDADGDAQDADKAPQPPEERARFAAARRKAEAERDAAIAQAKAEAQAEAQRTLDEAFRDSGMTNPYTGKPITSKAEFDAYRAQYDAARRAGLLKKTGMSDAEFEAFVADLPEVRQAQAAKAAAEELAGKAKREAIERKINADLQAITALDPDVRTLADLAALANYQDIVRLVGHGNSLYDAYRLANFEKLAARQAAAQEQAARNRTASKSHLTSTAARGTGAPILTQATIDAYREIDPDVTLEEIRQYEAKYQKGK